jgi:hypothetical protein
MPLFIYPSLNIRGFYVKVKKNNSCFKILRGDKMDKKTMTFTVVEKDGELLFAVGDIFVDCLVAVYLAGNTLDSLEVRIERTGEDIDSGYIMYHGTHGASHDFCGLEKTYTPERFDRYFSYLPAAILKIGDKVIVANMPITYSEPEYARHLEGLVVMSVKISSLCANVEKERLIRQKAEAKMMIEKMVLRFLPDYLSAQLKKQTEKN